MKIRRTAIVLIIAVMSSLLGAGCISYTPPGVLTGAIEGYVLKNVRAKAAVAAKGDAEPRITITPEPLESGTYVGLEGATVTIDGMRISMGLRTRSDGYFIADGLVPGRYTVRVSHEMFVDTYETACDVYPGRTSRVGYPVLGSLHILAVGINNYSIAPLRFARPDAEYIYGALGQANRYAKQSEVLVDGGATRSGILGAIERMGAQTQPGDTFIMYYSGHGSQSGWHEYIVPQDYMGSVDQMISDDELRDAVDMYVRADNRVFIFDSCYSGGMFKSAGMVYPRGFTGSTGFETMARNLSSAGNIVITACDKNELSYEADGFGHGVFTYYFVEGMKNSNDLRVGAYPADLNGDRRITTDEAFDYADYKVKQAASNFPGPQNPQIYRGPSSVDSRYIFMY